MLDQILDALRARRGVCLLTGEPGTGKTTVLRRALDELAARSPLVPICGNAPLDLDDLISLLGGRRGRSTPPASLDEQREEVIRRLRELTESGQPVVLAIDDAQALDDETLGHVSRLVGDASAPRALASLCLVGQPGLASRLDAWAARGVEIAVRCSLDPLGFEEVSAYIAHRSRGAGREAAELFSSAAVERIATRSGGVPRLINLLCREALETAERRGARRVEPDIVDDVAEDLGIAVSATAHLASSSRLAFAPRHVARGAMGIAAVAVLLLLTRLPPTPPSAPPAPNALEPSAPDRPGPPLPEPAASPSPDPRVAGPEPPADRSATRHVAEPPTRPGSVTRDRTARASTKTPSPSPPAPSDRRKDQGLLLRVENGDLAGVRALLGAGASPDARDRMGLTPLMLAVIRGDSAIANALLERGASVNAKNHAGQTALMMAAINNNRAALKALLDRGADVNARTTAGWTALMYAAWKGHPDIARPLLARGADANLRDGAGWTAQRYAAWRVSQRPAESEGVVTGVDNVEPSLPAGPGHGEVLGLLTESPRRN